MEVKAAIYKQLEKVRLKELWSLYAEMYIYNKRKRIKKYLSNFILTKKDNCVSSSPFVSSFIYVTYLYAEGYFEDFAKNNFKEETWEKIIVRVLKIIT